MGKWKSPPQCVESVEPIKDLRSIERIRESLGERPRDLLLFDLATRLGIRMKDLLRLKVKDLQGLKVGDVLPIGRGGSKRCQTVVMDEAVYATLQRYLKEPGMSPDDYVFSSRGRTKPVDASQVSRMIGRWFRAANLQGLRGSRSLRKTWEFHYKGDSPAGETASGSPDPHEVLRPVESVTLQERVYRELVRAILSGRIPPGERLVTERIAEQMQVSHMPVREALHRLEARGFLTAQKKRGYVLRELSAENLREITEMRLVLEPMAVKAACGRAEEGVIDGLRTLHKHYERAAKGGDMDEFLRLNKEFHFTIYRAANRPVLQEHIDRLWDRISPYLHILCRDIGDFDPLKSCENHQGMLEGMERRDAEEVVKWVKADLSEGARVLMQMFGGTDRKSPVRSY
jgi:DNA-binding GntR family transcriptional regulator